MYMLLINAALFYGGEGKLLLQGDTMRERHTLISDLLLAWAFAFLFDVVVLVAIASLLISCSCCVMVFVVVVVVL